MERGDRVMACMETFINNWNGEFPDYLLTVEDLKKPHAVIGALFQVFERLGIDRDAVLAPPAEEFRTESTTYFWDLLPAINMTRVINHLVAVMPQVNASVSITHFLQPTVSTSHSILMLLFNWMVFNEDRLRAIAPYEEQLFAKGNEVKALEDQKNKLLYMLNQQASEKGNRAERLVKLETDTKQLEEELAKEKEDYAEEKQELDTLLAENHQTEILLEQKKNQRDALTAEVERKRALRVYDADDIKTQAEQAAQNVQEAEEKLNSLRATLMQKESSLKNLQTIKPSLDTANSLLHEIMKLSESLKDLECGDLDSDSKEGELDVLNMEVSELEAQLTELQAAQREAADRRQESCARRRQQRTTEQSALREAEEKDRKCRERCQKALRKTEELKQLTLKYEVEKAAGFEEIQAINSHFCDEIKSIEEKLLKKVLEEENKITEKLRNRY